MASTYSTNLKIELIATGEQSGTWGTTTNTNLGTALEQAIVGYGNPNFTTDADLTISLTDSNATQTARNLVLNVTSSVSLTATRNLIVPTVQKPYIIRNNTTGSQSIVVKTSAGTGVTVPNGAYTVVYVDGTNVVSQITQLPALTLATALAATSGGTGQSSYAVGDLLYASTTTALSKLADVATGNALISGGVATAPSWGKIGLTTHVSGTLPVANGGTGSASLTANNVILGNGTSAVQVVAPGTSGNVLTSNGTTWTSTAGVTSVNGQTGAVSTITHLAVGAYQVLYNFSRTGVGSGSTAISASSLGYPTSAATFGGAVTCSGDVTVPSAPLSGPTTVAVTGTWQSMSGVVAGSYDAGDNTTTVFPGLFVRVA